MLVTLHSTFLFDDGGCIYLEYNDSCRIHYDKTELQKADKRQMLQTGCTLSPKSIHNKEREQSTSPFEALYFFENQQAIFFKVWSR